MFSGGDGDDAAADGVGGGDVDGCGGGFSGCDGDDADADDDSDVSAALAVGKDDKHLKLYACL